jgi:hypothetical protein
MQFAIVTAVVLVLGVTTLVLTQSPRAPVAGVGALPKDISLCGRHWQRGNDYSPAEASSRFANTPIVEDIATATCPPGACSEAATTGACAAAFLVRAGDRYVAYVVAGGP